MLDEASHAWLDATLRGDQAEADRLEAVLDAATLLEQQRRNRPERIRDEALELAAHGVPVFPIRPRGKQPLTRHGFKDATTDPAVIAEWFEQWPDANLAMPTGVAFDVIDVDGPAGMARMYAKVDPMIDGLDVLGIATTSRDGGRHIYVPVTGRGNKAALYPGIDYRGDGGYVVVPPSVGDNGRRYEWLEHPLHATRSEAA